MVKCIVVLNIEMRSHLLSYIQEQTCLEYLLLCHNKFDSDGTGELLSSVLQSSSISTIIELALTGSCDFSADETCALFAQLIDTATKLENCHIAGQVGERKIKAEMQVASEEDAS